MNSKETNKHTPHNQTHKSCKLCINDLEEYAQTFAEASKSLYLACQCQITDMFSEFSESHKTYN